MQITSSSNLIDLPDHVQIGQVFHFDLYSDAGLQEDIQQGYRDLQLRAPEIFYTPHNGGHWMVTRSELVQRVLKDAATFSSVEISVPKTADPIKEIPINLDPPEHTGYRHMLMKYFTPKMVKAREDSMLRWAKVVIDRVYEEGYCEFTETVGAAFPVYVFMEMMGLPLGRFAEFRSIATEFFGQTSSERRHELAETITAVIDEAVEDRLKQPKEDMISRLLEDGIDNRKLTRDELRSIGFLLFVAGLDTVANAMSFMFHYLAKRPDLQELLRKDPEQIPSFVEETLRRFPIIALSRLVTKDVELAGAQLKAGDMITAPVILANLDDRAFDNPMDFDMQRPRNDHIAFSVGPHLCMGHRLARAELQLFVGKFLERIPRFRLPEGFKPRYRPAGVMALENLELEWDLGEATRA